MPSKPLSSPRNETNRSLLPCLSRALTNAIFPFISLKFHFKTLELRNIWSSRRFYSKFAAHGMGWNLWKFFIGQFSLNVFVYQYCNSKHARVWQGRESIANKGERFTYKETKTYGWGWTNGERELAYERERESWLSARRANLCVRKKSVRPSSRPADSKKFPSVRN